MNPQPRSLVWKEWHEWRLPFGLCMLWMIVGSAISIAEPHHDLVGQAWGIANLYMLFLPIFVAMKVALGETTAGTRSFNDGLPLSLRRRAVLRWFSGALVLSLPILIAAFIVTVPLSMGWIQQRDNWSSNPNDVRLVGATVAVRELWFWTSVAIVVTHYFYAFLVVLGTTQPSEARAGFVGAAVMVVWLFLNLAGGEWYFVLLSVSPTEDGSPVWNLTALLGNGLIQLLLALLFVERYGRRKFTAPQVGRKSFLLLNLSRWKRPFASPSAAMAYLVLRQSLPLCFVGLFFACVINIAIPLMNGNVAIVDLPRELATGLYSEVWVIGLLWSVVVAVGLFTAESDERTCEFLRGVPVGPFKFFAIKFGLGLAAVLLVLDGTAVAVHLLSPDPEGLHQIQSFAAVFVPLHTLMFAVAAAWICLLRQPILAGIASLFTFSLPEVLNRTSYSASELIWMREEKHIFADESYFVIVGAIAVMITVWLLVSWLGFRRRLTFQSVSVLAAAGKHRQQ